MLGGTWFRRHVPKEGGGSGVVWCGGALPLERGMGDATILRTDPHRINPI